MKNKTRTFTAQEQVKFRGVNYTVLVYGELEENDYMDGFLITPVQYTGRGKVIRGYGNEKSETLIQSYNEMPSRTKHFNMGWAICNDDCDKFDLETGIKIAKKRFAKSDMTTQNGRFLTKDMICAIVNNEAEYIVQHIYEYIPETNVDCQGKKEYNNYNNKVKYCEKVSTLTEDEINNYFWKKPTFKKGDWVISNDNEEIFGVVEKCAGNMLTLKWVNSSSGIIWNVVYNYHSFNKIYGTAKIILQNKLKGMYNLRWNSEENKFEMVY